MKTDFQGNISGWNEQQVSEWYNDVVAAGKTRDYQEIVARVQALPANTHTVEIYAMMEGGHPVLRISVGDIKNGKPNILITGGIHGYEPSGVEASVRFLKEQASELSKEFNFVVYPCLSPWAYEYNQRWNAQAEDPNRLFTKTAGKAQEGIFRTFDIKECRHFMTSIENHGVNFACAIDLHETSDRDIELRELRAKRFGSPLAADYKDIPQGYYLTLSKENTPAENAHQLLFGQSIIDEVQKVSPIAPEGNILGGTPNYGGVILSPKHDGVARTFLHKQAKLVAVTEVYPNHPDMDPEKAIQAQLKSIHGALNYVRGMTA